MKGPSACQPAGHEMMSDCAIVLAMFGTSVAGALPALLNIRDRMADRFPSSPIRLAFTSAGIRRIWHQRGRDRGYRAAHPGVPAEIFAINDLRTVLAALLDAGHPAVIVQPVYMAPGGEYRELRELIGELNAPPVRLILAHPALGSATEGSAGNEDELLSAARALAEDVELARGLNAALLYMGHGARRCDVEPLYQRFAGVMRLLYPDVLTVIGTVEGERPLAWALARFRENSTRRVLLKPFMVTAGNHVRMDMVGPPPRGWKPFLERHGLTVEPVLRGLGEQDAFARIFVERAAAAAVAAGMVPR